MRQTKRISTRQLTLGAMLTALVVALQFVAMAFRGPTFSISLVLVPIVVGAALCNPYIGAWLGFVFGLVVLFSGDATAFMQINAPATIFVVLLKGTASGLIAGFVYRALEKINGVVATIVAAIVCPLVNTGVFFVGCMLFFIDQISVWAQGAGFGSAVTYVVVIMIGINFLIEMAINLVLSPVIVRLLNIRRKQTGN